MSKFGKALAKKVVALGEKSATIHTGFAERILWTSSGSIALNLLLTGNPKKAFCFSKSCIIGGESGSGKSLVLATGARTAQKDHNAFVVWLDAEKASEKEWFERTGMDLSEENFFRAEVATIEDVKGIFAKIVETYDNELAAHKKGDGEHPRPVFLVIDSYTVLMTESQLKQAEAGEVVGDQGQQAKQLGDLIKAITHLSARRDISANGVVHTMQEQNTNPKVKVKTEIMLGGRKLAYMASMSFVFTKYNLVDGADDDGEEESSGAKKVIGIRAMAKLYKSRFAKPNEKVEIHIPYDTGIDLYSGVFKKFKDEGLIVMPTNGWYNIHPDYAIEGLSNFRKGDFRQHADAIIEKLYPDDVIDVVRVTETDIAEAEKDDDTAGLALGSKKKTKKAA